MFSRLRTRLEAIEAQLKKPRIFVFVHYDGDGPSFEERKSAFCAEEGVGPDDRLYSLCVTFDGP